MLSSVQNPRILLLHCRRSKPLHHHYAKSIHATPLARPISASLPTSQIQTIQKSILSREKTTRQFAEEFLNRLRLTEPHVKSFLHVSETVLNEADEIDRKIDRNEDVGPLAGVLVAVKDNICTADMPSTAGSKLLENYRPAFDETAVKKLKESGAIIVGKTNLDEVGMGSTTEGSAYQQAALSDEYFVKRRLYPNVDFYSGLIYRAMGFPTEFFPVLFAIPRMAGYLSHWRESLDDPDTKIMRPAQVYTGVWMRHYIPAQERMSSTGVVVDKLGQVSVSNATKRRLSGSGV